MPQRLQMKAEKLCTTISPTTLQRIDSLARATERGGRRYSVTRTEVVELAVEWMYSKVQIDLTLFPQPVRRQEPYQRLQFALTLPAMRKLNELAKKLASQENYVRRWRARYDVAVGEAIDWCVEHFWTAMQSRAKGAKNAG